MTIPDTLTALAVPVEGLAPYHRNPRTHADALLRESLARHSQYRPIVVNRGTRTGRPDEILAGNGTYAAAVALGWQQIAATYIDVDDDEAARIVLVDNRANDLAGYDDTVLAELLGQLDGDLGGTGYDPADLEALLAAPDPEGRGAGGDTGIARATLAERFGVPPFSVLDGRQGYWKTRKRAWLDLGIQSEIGRDDNLLWLSELVHDPAYYSKKSAAEARLGRELTNEEFAAEHYDGKGRLPGTSVFDPVLTELLVRWFSPPGGRVLDPFAGGSVRGLVSARLGRHYTGIDLRAEQVEANEAQAQSFAARGLLAPPSPELLRDPAALTPVELHGGHPVKRDDLFGVGDSAGGKVRTCLHLAAGAAGLTTAGSRHSPQVNIVATVAASLGLPCRVHVPAAAGGLTPELAAAVAAGAELVEHRPGHNTVIVARARTDAADRGWVNIPFGMDDPAAVAMTSAQVANLPEETQRVVIPVGSGMSLAGLLAGLQAQGRALPILGVVVGADPSSRLDRHAPAGWRDMVTLVGPDSPYDLPAPATALGGLELDPIYEAKCLPYLLPGDLLWVVGCRATARPTPHPQWVVGDARDAERLAGGQLADMLLTCPPYFDLEVYSAAPADLSTAADYPTFLRDLESCLRAATSRLTPEAFAAIVAAEVRDKRGAFQDLPGDTTRIMGRLGFWLYNVAVLVTPAGSLPVRAGRAFQSSRKLGRTHQSVLVYYRGDPGLLRNLGPVDMGDPAEYADEEAELTEQPGA